MLSSSTSTERRKPAADPIVRESEPQPGSSEHSGKGVAGKQEVSLRRKAAHHTLNTNSAKKESRAASHADGSAKKQSSGRTRRVSAVSDKAREGLSAEQRSQAGEDRTQGLNTGRPRPSNATEQQSSGSRATKESRAQPKQLLTELVKQASIFNASPLKRQSAPAEPMPRAASRPAADSKGAKLEAPPGLEIVTPASTALRKAGARS